MIYILSKCLPFLRLAVTSVRAFLLDLYALLSRLVLWASKSTLRQLILILSMILGVLLIRGCHVQESNAISNKEAKRNAVHTTSNIKRTIQSTIHENVARAEQAVVSAAINATGVHLDPITSSRLSHLGGNTNSDVARDGKPTRRLGFSYGYPKEAGLAIKAYQFRDLDLSLGGDYFFKEKKLEPEASIGYNIHKLTHDWTQSTTIFGGRTITHWTFGVRLYL
jgi:hypothetical protein